MSYRFAIIGCGSIAGRHADQIVSHGVLAGVCDVDEVRARSLAEKHHTTAYRDFSALLQQEKPDIVSVCTPNGWHASHAIGAMEAGAHVLCEKPMAIKTADGLEMIRVARETGRRLFVVKQNRHNPPVKAVRKLIEEGRLGKIHGFQVNCFWNRPAAYYQSPWRGTRSLDGGILFTQFSHFIDLLYWFLGEIREVSGWRSNYLHKGLIEFEDTGVAAIVMKNGAIGTLHYTVNAHLSNMEGSLSLFGEKGTVKIGGEYLNRMEYFSVDGMPVPELAAGNAANRYGAYTGSMSNHGLVYSEMLRSLGDPACTPVEAAEALKSVEMIEQIYAASSFI